MPPPQHPKVYHILHVDRLPSVVRDGRLWSDAVMSRRPGLGTTVGMSTIKARRLILPVGCHPGTHVGDYVPFYFCSRSVMLYVIHRADHAELAYRGGQEPIVHLEADLREVADWADVDGRRWAFSLANAGARYTRFHRDLTHLDEIDWRAVSATDFRPPGVKEAKQAEFLLYESIPWTLIRRIGVRSQATAQRVAQALAHAAHRPPVQVLPGWYY